MVQVAEVAHVGNDTVEEQAKLIWAEMVSACKGRHLPIAQTRNGAGYFWIGSIQSFATQILSHLGSNKKPIGSLRQFLKASGNVITVEQDTDSHGNPRNRIFVRAEWNSAIAIPVRGGGGTGKDRIDIVAERLTPHEAGEDRDPPPVQVRRRPTPTPTERTDPLVCTICGKKWDTSNARNAHMAAHRKTDVPLSGSPTEQETEAPVPTLTPEVPTVTTSSGRGLVDILQEALASASTVQERLSLQMIENSKLSGRLAQMEAELTSVLADNRRLQQEGTQRATPEATVTITGVDVDPNVAQLAADRGALIELFAGVIDNFNNGEIGPVRALADLAELLNGIA
jgi:hypothetical protein